MNGRLYRLTPAGGKPNHYTDSYASALAKCPPLANSAAFRYMQVGDAVFRDPDWPADLDRVERVA